MKFDEFGARIDQIRHQDLPGIEAYEKILPAAVRQRLDAQKSDPNPKLSGVAATVYPDGNEATLILIERQTYKGVHSGQIGFPGGKMELVDKDLMETALREMEEEVGLPKQLPQFVRALSNVYIPPSKFLVHPFLFQLDKMPELNRQEREVKSIIHLPISMLLDDRILKTGYVETSGYTVKTAYFEMGKHKIWGATAMMLSELKWILKHT